jgi:hypothetical protein
MWLTSFDPEGVWPPTRVTLLRRVQIGNRRDHAWAGLDPPIPLGQGPDVAMVILGARHQGFDIWAPTSWPIHVFICTVERDLANRDSFAVDEVRIARWGRLHETLEGAESNEM